MAVERRRRTVYQIAFAVMIVAIVIPALLRTGQSGSSPSVEILGVDGTLVTVSLQQMKRLPALTREGMYQNQFENWRDEGTYTGVLVSDLLSGQRYGSVVAIASDGYEVSLSRARIEDPEYPVVLAYAFDGIEVPAWEDGFRIAVLPEDGSVSNLEYDATSAGSFWIKNVAQLRVDPSE